VNVLIVQRRLTEYRVPLFEELRTLLSERGIHLSVVHGTAAREEEGRRDNGMLPWAVRTRSRHTRILGRRLAWTSIPHSLLAKQDLIVVTHENGIISNYPLFVRDRLGGPMVAWWGHGPKVLGAQIPLVERLKSLSARCGRWYFAYTAESVRRSVAAGVPPDRISCLDNAVEREDHPRFGDAAWNTDRERMKQELGIGEAPVAIYLGSLTPEKRIPMLIEAADALHRRIPDFRLLVVGDGPLRDAVQRAAATRAWLRWLGVRHGRGKAMICSLAHAMLNPGMVGLNIVDAFAMGLPLVTMRHDLHSPEVAYLEDGRNGLITQDDLDSFVAASARALTDAPLRKVLLAGCREAAHRYTLGHMAENFVEGIERALRTNRNGAQRPPRPVPAFTVAVVLRTFLPYHAARLRRLRRAFHERGIRLCEIEVASEDAAYGFLRTQEEVGEPHHCCFPGVNYQSLTPTAIHAKVTEYLQRLRPDIIIGHASPFPEGMAGIAYRNRSAARVFVVDDAWAATDRSSGLVRAVKRVIHRSVDGAIVSSGKHAEYYATLGIPADRSAIGWSVVDNEHYAELAEAARRDSKTVRHTLGLPERYFLFVGRFLRRKGISDLIRAHERYLSVAEDPWPLVLVGGTRSDAPAEVTPSPAVMFAGPRFGIDLARIIGLAGGLVVPSLLEQWGLVINEGMAAGTVVIASRACGGAHLLRDGESGYTYEAGDVGALTDRLTTVASLPETARIEIGRAAQGAVADWGLDRFVESVSRALGTPRQTPAGLASRLAVRFWKGRVRAY
jgi:L-malate glycosyltransferase